MRFGITPTIIDASERDDDNDDNDDHDNSPWRRDRTNYRKLWDEKLAEIKAE